MVSSKSWYVLYTKPRSETLAEENLQRQGFTTYLPRCVISRNQRQRWQDKIEPLFPRYLFLHLDLQQDNSAPIRSTRGVAGFVKFAGIPATIADSFIADLMERKDAETGMHALHTGNLNQGDKVRIMDGPLAEMEAVFWTYKGNDRVLLLLNMLGQDSYVSVARKKIARAA